MDPLQWMGAVRMRVQTADKNITIIHTTPVCQLMSCTSNRDDCKLENTVKQSWFKHLGELHKEWTEAGVSASRVTTVRRLQEKGYQATSEPETTSEASYLGCGEKELSGPKSSFQMKVNFAFHLETRSQSLEEEWRGTESMLLDWPANSPDLNPIENLWGIVKRKMRDTRPNNADELKAAIKETWASIPPQQCHKLITSMPRRIEAVIKAKGAPAKYWVHTVPILDFWGPYAKLCRGGWMRMDETHLSVFLSVSNRAQGKRSRSSISSAARISSRFFGGFF